MPVGGVPKENREDKKISEVLLLELQSYLKNAVVADSFVAEDCAYMKKEEVQSQRSLEKVMSELKEPFQKMLFRLIDQKGFSDIQVYKKANMDRKLFSKIKCNPQYVPKKQTVIALAIALELSLDEALDLLNRAGYGLSPGNKSDVIIRYFLERKEYDILLINEALFMFEQQPL